MLQMKRSYFIVTEIVPVFLSLSVTVMVVLPAFTPLTVILASLVVAVATCEFLTFTTKGAVPFLIVISSVLPVLIETDCLSNSRIFDGSITVTLIVPVFLFLSVTVIVVVPAVKPLIAIFESLTVAVAILESLTVAV